MICMCERRKLHIKIQLPSGSFYPTRSKFIILRIRSAASPHQAATSSTPLSNYIDTLRKDINILVTFSIICRLVWSTFHFWKKIVRLGRFSNWDGRLMVVERRSWRNLEVPGWFWIVYVCMYSVHRCMNCAPIPTTADYSLRICIIVDKIWLENSSVLLSSNLSSGWTILCNWAANVKLDIHT